MDENDPRPAAEADAPADPLPEPGAAGSADLAGSDGAAARVDADTPGADGADAAEEVAAAGTGFAGRHPVLVYTALRLGILVAVAAVLYLLGARGLILLVFAFLISGLISMVALQRPREGAAYGITSTVRKVNDRIDAAARAEDEDDIDDLMGDVAPDRSRPTPPPTS